MWLCTQHGFPFSSFIKCITIYALFPSYYCTKYIDNYSNTASGIPACLGLFVSCLSDRLVDIVSDLPLLSLGIIIANPSLSGIWLSLLYLSVAFLSIPKSFTYSLLINWICRRVPYNAGIATAFSGIGHD